MTTVTWTQDVNSNFEVSSAEHLKQLMHKGALYTDAGSFPTDYYATGTNYKQTADIDLLNDSADITPIGIDGDTFKGSYDGGEFRISNWSYTDSGSTPLGEVGLFGYSASPDLKNLRLDGLWTLEGFDVCAGYLAGRHANTSNSTYGIRNIECDFSDGSFIAATDGKTYLYVGSVFGRLECYVVTGITLKGSVDLRPGVSNVRSGGGIIGQGLIHGEASLIQNLATFPSGINGRDAGGIAGAYSTYNGITSRFINAMTGDITGDSRVGGVLGNVSCYYTTDNVSSLVNAMTGNITNTSSTLADPTTGGIIGYFQIGTASSGFLNYMTGDVSMPNGGGSGGLVGYYHDSADVALSASINAMNGDVDHAIIAGQNNTNLSVSDVSDVVTDTSFGLTYTTDGYGTSSPSVGLSTNAGFNDLPYITLDGSDSNGVSYDFDFVFANLSGKSSYSSYTHLILHKGDISTPIDVNFDILETNTTVYLTYINGITCAVLQPALVVISTPLLTQARPRNTPVLIEKVVEANGTWAIGYNVTYEGPTGGEITALSGVTTLKHNITGLDPETQYTVRLYTDKGTGYELTEELVLTTLPDVAANYDITDFEDENGATDLASVDASTLSNMAGFITELVNTGDVVIVAAGISNTEIETSFVDVGEAVSIHVVDGILVPFAATSGAAVSLTLRNATIVPVTYDEVNNTITVETVTYTTGDTFFVDGYKLEVFDYYGLIVISVEKPIVTWVQDVAGNYEVSSANHLKQLMHRGTLFTDSGSIPTDYWAVNYIQTADIDLFSDSTDIHPIGEYWIGDPFNGGYDGGEFQISNWSYLDPTFSDPGASSASRVGLFGNMLSGTLQNMRLSGLWTLQGCGSYGGFLVGYCDNGGTSLNGVRNIEGDFADGSFIELKEGEGNAVSLGSLSGYLVCEFITGLTVKGSIDFRPNSAGSNYMGGVSGLVWSGGIEIKLVQNQATFPSGIVAKYAAGIFATCYFPGGTVTQLINAMTGDITGSTYAGGVMATCSGVGASYTNLINSMTGNITGDGAATTHSGGICAVLNLDSPCSGFLNYMTGDIVNGGGVDGGGLIGRFVNNTGAELNSTVNAMNGNVLNATVSVVDNLPLTTTMISTVTEFGLTFTTDDYGTSTLPANLSAFHSEFPDLPYVDLVGTDSIGNSYDYDFVFANLGGNNSYSTTHLIIAQGIGTFQNGVDPPPLIVTPRATNLPVSFLEVTGATGYNVTIEGPTGGEITAVSGVTELEHNITGVEPETTYTVKLYADTGTGYELTEEFTTTTLPNVAANYDITDFQEENGVTDLTSLDASTLSNIAGVITELVNTGDVVSVAVEGTTEIVTSFVDVGEAINLADVDGLLLPFEVSSGAGQTIDLTLSDATTVPVTYDEVLNTITVETTSYSDGDAIYLDGNKLEVFDYYGLTVVSVDVAPLLVEPGPINIPVVITEVPGAVGYNVTYQGPTGGEITAFSGVTTLDQNITGLISGTEYTIKLYADTGSGYVLTEELTTTTLANVAANYDVNIFVKDGIINLSSLPDATISNIGEVMNELFTTGDLVSVSLQGKPELNTSFINLGDELSIDAIDGVLLPFVEASTPGQDVSVVLSDGSTIVGINFDEAVNTITVNGVTYSPGDSFILDGKKVTVVEY